jgi:Xaa-Pro dipeptidase
MTQAEARETGQMLGGDPLDLPFTIEEYRARLGRVHGEMAALDLDLLLVHPLENTYWLTGYRTIGFYSYMCLMVAPGADPVHLSRLIELGCIQGSSWVPDIETYPDTENYLDATVRVLSDRGWDRGRVGIDLSAPTLGVRDFETLKERMPDVAWVDTSLMIENMRLIKSPAEQDYSRKAGKAASEGSRAGLASLRAGITEDDLMAATYQGLFSMGSEYPGLPPLITAGLRNSMGHAMSEGNPVNDGDPVYFEVGASIKRYHAATMRIGYVGTAPKLFHDLHDLCCRAIDAAIAKMKPGVPAEDVDHAARSIIEDGGYGDKFRHKCGYSIGIALPPDWSEAGTMMLRGGEKRLLKPGMVFHVLPAVFEYKLYGVGVSETVLITDDGHEILTDVERKLHEVK